MLIDASFTDLKAIDKIIKLLPLFSPVIIFLFGYFLKFLDEKRNISREIRATQSFCLSWLNVSKDSVKKFYESVINYSTYIREVDNRPVAINAYNAVLNKINEIKSLQIYNAFVTNKIGDIDYRTQLYFDFSTHVDAVNLNYENLKAIYKQFCNFDDDILNKWVQLDIVFRDYRSKFNTSTSLDYVLFVNKFYTEKEFEKTNTIGGFVSNIVDPFINSSNDFFKKYPNDKDLIELVHIIDDFHVMYNRWKNTREQFANNFETIINLINNSYEKLNHTMRQIEELKFRHLFQLK